MQILIKERHAAVSDEVKTYVQQKAEKLLRFFDRISSIEVILDGAQDQAGVEMIVKADRTEDFVAHDANGDFFAGVDVVVDKLERQLRKHKEKQRNRKHVAKNPDWEEA